MKNRAISVAAFAAVVALVAPVSGASALTSAVPGAGQSKAVHDLRAPAATSRLGSITVLTDEAIKGAGKPSLDGEAVQLSEAPRAVAEILDTAGLPAAEVEKVFRVGEGMYTVWYPMTSDTSGVAVSAGFRSAPATLAATVGGTPVTVGGTPVAVPAGPSRFKATMDVLAIPFTGAYAVGGLTVNVIEHFGGLLASVPRALVHRKFGDVGPLIAEAFRKSVASAEEFRVEQAASVRAKVAALHAAWNPVVIGENELAAIRVADRFAGIEKAMREAQSQVAAEAARLRDDIILADIREQRAREAITAADKDLAAIVGVARTAEAGVRTHVVRQRYIDAVLTARAAADGLLAATSSIKALQGIIDDAASRTARARKIIADARQTDRATGGKAPHDPESAAAEKQRLMLENDLAEATEQVVAAIRRHNAAKSKPEEIGAIRASIVQNIAEFEHGIIDPYSTPADRAISKRWYDSYVEWMDQVSKDYEKAAKEVSAARDAEAKLIGDLRWHNEQLDDFIFSNESRQVPEVGEADVQKAPVEEASVEDAPVEKVLSEAADATVSAMADSTENAGTASSESGGGESSTEGNAAA